MENIKPDKKESSRHTAQSHSAVNGSSLNISGDPNPRRPSSSSSGAPPSKPARPSTLPGPPGGIKQNLEQDLENRDRLPSTPPVHKVIFLIFNTHSLWLGNLCPLQKDHTLGIAASKKERFYSNLLLSTMRIVVIIYLWFSNFGPVLYQFALGGGGGDGGGWWLWTRHTSNFISGATLLVLEIIG